jgi:hypothetical protein
MDFRAFGSYYGQSATLPYASGFVVASATSKNFGTARGFCTLSQGSVQVEFSDSQGQTVLLSGLAANTLIPFAITSISGVGTTASTIVLY